MRNDQIVYRSSCLISALLISLTVTLFPVKSNAQSEAENGLPFITNYAAKTFKALPQVWCVQEDDRGMMYFGVQNFILEYDGIKWRKITVEGGASTVVRSLTKNKKGLIYYGAYGNLGYLDKDSLGQTRTRSLLGFIPEENRNFLDIWTAYATDNSIYFQSREYIFRLSEPQKTNDGKREVKVWKPQTKFMYSFYLDGNYYVHQQGLGLYKMIEDSLTLIPGSGFLGKERVQVMLPYRDGPNGEKQYLFGMFYSGLYLYNGNSFRPFITEADDAFKTGTILYKGIQLKNGNYALSTTGKGLIVIDEKGKLLEKINREVGLQDESIYSTFLDKKGMLWLALDNGLSRVETASPLTQFTLQSGINTGVLSMQRFNGNLYLGTTNGLLVYDSIRHYFEPVPGIPQNQIFSLTTDGNELLVPGDGLFSVKNKKAYTIRPSVSADLTLSAIYIYKKNPNILLGGGPFGIAIFYRTNESSPWIFGGNIPGVAEQIWSFSENKDGTLWAGSANSVVYRLAFVIDQHGIPNTKKTIVETIRPDESINDLTGIVININGKSYFTADSVLYVFDDNQKKFIQDTTFGRFPDGGVASEFAFVEDYSGRVWIRGGKVTRVALPKPGGGYTLDDSQLNSLTDYTIQYFYPEKSGIVWVCTTDGLIRYDENLEKNYDQSFKSILRHISAGKSALNTDTPENKPVSISFKNNTLRFEYAAPFFEQETKTQYQTWLEGFEDNWSGLDNNYYKEFTNLPPGHYTFHVRAVNIYGKQSEEAVYSFEILPPWYKTWWAYLIYALVAVVIIYVLIHWRTRHLHEKHRELEKTVADRTKELSHRVEELAVINSVQEGLVREMDIQGIYDLVGEKIREIFNAQVIDIVTYESKTNLMEDRYAYEKGDRTLVGTWEPYGFRKHVIDTKKALLINKDLAQKSKEFSSKVIRGEQPKSAVFVPMISGGKVTGMISLQNLDIENAFSDSDVSLLTTLANSMSVALSSAQRFDETNRLLKETEQRTAELAVINSVQEGLAKELDMQGIYDLIGERIRDLFDAQVVAIATFNHEAKTEKFEYLVEKGERFYPEPRPFDKLRDHLIQNRERILINTHFVEALNKFGMKAVSGTEIPKSALYVPLVIGDKITSYVTLQNIDKENAFSDADVRLLETLANSMSVALENARLFDETNRLLKETEQRTAELAVINSVQEGLASELDIKSIYELVGEKIREIFNAQVIDIVTYDKTTNLIEDRYTYEKGDRTLLAPRPLKGFRKHVIETGKPLAINKNLDLQRPKYDQAVMIGEGAKSLVMVPMIAGGEVNGVISLQNLDVEDAFPDSDVRLLTTLVNSMSVALENARLFDETNRLLKETEQRTAELAVINSVQEGLAKELDIQGIYELVGDRLCDLFPDTQTLVIRTFDLENGIEHFHYAIEKGVRFPIDARAFNWSSKELIATKKPLDIRENYVEIAKKHGGTGVTKGQPPKSAVFVPMLVGDTVKGSVSLQNVDKEHAFTDSDLRLLTTITNSMSVALENARLFDETSRLLKETEQRTAELAVINSVQEGLVREMNMQAIYDMVGNRICELFDTQTVLIRTFDHRSGMETWQYAIEKGQRLYSNPRPLIWANKELINSKQPLLINENYIETAQKHGGAGVSKGLPPKSALFVPMAVGGIVKGSVSLQNVEKENAFTESDLRLLTTLTNSMSVALENARLFDETNRLLGETKQRASELATVNNISQALSSQLNLEQLIKLVGDELGQLFKANIVYIALLDKSTNIISFPYQYGDDMEPLKLGEGLTSKIILTGEPLLINKDLQEQRAQLGVQQIGIPAASYLGVPIPVGDEVIGVLSVQSTEQENRFNEDDMRLLRTIASSVGIALRKAKLFEEIHQAKMDAEEARKTAEKANEAKSAFLSTVSHELRTPLTSVLGFAKIIRKRLEEKVFPLTDKSDAKTDKTIHQISENLSVVVSEGERLTHLINDVLDLAKIEAGKMEWNMESVSMAEVAERAIAATSSLFEHNNLALEKNIQANVPEISGDKDKLIQVMVNLISNSVKFTPKGKVTCKVSQQDQEIVVSISDTGIGIAPEDHAAVFEQFKQVGDTLTDKPKGTGLGLPICKEIIEHHGGRIWLESELGKGSIFLFALPVTKTATATAKPIHLEDLVRQLKEQVEQSQLNIKGKSASILIVDDDDSIRSLLQQELSDAGYIIDEAKNGKEALEQVRKKRPDLIILDIMMPEMNGFDVAAVLKNDPQTMDIPIIVLSIVQDKTRGFRIGVDRYLTKPIDTGVLFKEIGSLLEQGKSKKKVMIVDEDSNTANTLADVLKTKGYVVIDNNGNGENFIEKAVANQPDIIIINSLLSGNQDIVKSLRFEKGMENVLFLVYQ